MTINNHNEVGYFNVYPLKTALVDGAKTIPFKRRDFYKIMLVIGQGKVNYADRVVKVEKQVLSFSNPTTPYSWEDRDKITDGFSCIFNKAFFHQFGDLSQYSVFQPNGEHIFELTDEQVSIINEIFERMFKEINTDYVHKYDLLRNLVFELLHFASKLQPAANHEKQNIDAAQRISTLFLELLERQFLIDDNILELTLRSPSDFAFHLNIHVNYLNRAVKKITHKTTSQIIGERILQESKIMLKHSDSDVSIIAYALGFKEVTHFNNFFKKHTHLNPTKFRNNGTPTV